MSGRHAPTLPTPVLVTSREVLLDESLPGYLRAADAGDGRHVLVAGAGGWQALDLGWW